MCHIRAFQTPVGSFTLAQLMVQTSSQELTMSLCQSSATPSQSQPSWTRSQDMQRTKHLQSQPQPYTSWCVHFPCAHGQHPFLDLCCCMLTCPPISIHAHAEMRGKSPNLFRFLNLTEPPDTSSWLFCSLTFISGEQPQHLPVPSE